MVVAEPQLPVRAQHAARDDAANLGRRQLLEPRLRRVSVPEPGALVREGDLVANREVPRAAHHLELRVARGHRRQVEPIGVGMGVDAHDFTHHHAVPMLTGAMNLGDLEARVG